MIAGVAAGFAEFIDANPTVVRWVFGVVTVLTSGFFVLIYALLWLILPKPPDEPVS
jgi:phage shock protein C